MKNRATASLSRALTLSVALLLVAAASLPAQDITLSQAPGGMPITPPPYKGGFGNVNGLGIGTPDAGINLDNTGVTGGVFYWSPISMTITGATSVVRAYLITNVSNPATLTVYVCTSGPCASFSSYAVLSTSPASPAVIVAPPGAAPNTVVTFSLGLFVSSANGAGAFTGSDSAAVVRFNIYNSTGGTLMAGHNLRLNNPPANVQTAVQLLLAPASGGLPLSPASDFSVDYNNVNGLGIGSLASGITLVPAGGGVVYSTPYRIQPSFSGFSSTTGSVSTYVSGTFAHPNTLMLQDSPSSGGPYANISNVPGSPTSITPAAPSGTPITRYLGLFVSSADGPGAFPGTSGASGVDSATLTYTLTVP